MHNSPERSMHVEIKGIDEKCQITVVFVASVLGDFLPIHIIYGG